MQTPNRKKKSSLIGSLKSKRDGTNAVEDLTVKALDQQLDEEISLEKLQKKIECHQSKIIPIQINSIFHR